MPEGDVLIAGGQTSSGSTTQASIFNPSTDQFTALGAGHELQAARVEAVAAPLPDGDVLIAGGNGSGSSAELFDTSTDTFTALTGTGQQMTTSRREAFASPLPNGDVLIAGGRSSSGQYLMSAELFDPTTGTFTALDSAHTHLVAPRSMPSAGLLSSGQVLITGGGSLNAEVFDPENETFYSLELSGGVLSEDPEGDLMVPIAGSNSALIVGGQLGYYEFSNSAEILDASPANAQVAGGEFGAQTVDRPDATQSLIVSSTGILPLTIDSVTLDGPDAEDFSVKADYCEGETLFLKQTCTIAVGFTPSAVGPRTAQVTLHYGATSVVTIPLTGTGAEPESATKGASDSTFPAITVISSTTTTSSQQSGDSSPRSKSCSNVAIHIVRAGRSSASTQTIKACGLSGLASATRVKLTRRGKVFASGGGLSAGTLSLHLHKHRALKAGYYTLTFASGHGWSARVARLVVKLA